MFLEDGDVPRTNFDDLLWSFTTVFVVMTRENWQAVLYDGMNSAGAASAIYFVSLVILTNYILLALFIGTLLENFEKFFLQGAEEDAKKEQAKEQKRLDNLVAGDSMDKSTDSGGSPRATGELLVSAVPAAQFFVQDAKEKKQPSPEKTSRLPRCAFVALSATCCWPAI